MDPFEGKYDGNYSVDVREAVSGMEVGETRETNVRIEDIRKFRSTLFHYQSRSGLKFRTKVDEDGKLWVKRIKQYGQTKGMDG